MYSSQRIKSCVVWRNFNLDVKKSEKKLRERKSKSSKLRNKGACCNFGIAPRVILKVKVKKDKLFQIVS